MGQSAVQEIRYEIDENDTVQATTQIALDSKTSKRAVRRCSVFLSLYFLIAFGFLGLLASSQQLRFLIWGVGAALALLLPALQQFRYRRATLSSIRGFFRERTAVGVYCDHSLEITREGVARSNEWNKLWLSWKCVTALKETERYCILVAGPGQNIIIPKTKVLQGNLQELWAEATACWEQYHV